MEEIAIDIFTGADGRILDRLDGDAILHLGDGARVEGCEAVHRHTVRNVRREFDILKIDHAITHGRVGSANGVLLAEGRQTGFCVVVEFVNTKAERLETIKPYGG